MPKIKRYAAPLFAFVMVAGIYCAGRVDGAGTTPALDGSDGRFGIGKGRYDHFKPDPRVHVVRAV